MLNDRERERREDERIGSRDSKIMKEGKRAAKIDPCTVVDTHAHTHTLSIYTTIQHTHTLSQ